MIKATINLENGKKINLDLDEECAPISTANFVWLLNLQKQITIMV